MAGESTTAPPPADSTLERWSDARRCTLWLAGWQLLYVPYLMRMAYLIAHPESEPYFDRDVLRIFSVGMTAVILASLVLYLIARRIDRSGMERWWLPHAATQLNTVWLIGGAYVLGPFTSPVLALFIVAACLSALLFSRAVVLSALVTAVVFLFALTVAERAGAIPYAPLLLAQLPLAGGRLTSEYVIGTGVASAVIILVSGALASYLVDQRRARERELEEFALVRQQAHARLERALDSLRNSEELFRQLAENTREVFWMIDGDTGKLLYIGPGFTEMWGIAAEELFVNLGAFMRRVHPDDLETLNQRFLRLPDFIARDTETSVEYRIQRPDGGTRWISIRSFPIRDGEGRLYRLGGLMEDVTERKQNEAALLQSQAELERRVAERTAALSEVNERLTLEAAERLRAEQELRRSQEQLHRQFVELDQLYRTAPIGLALHDTSMRYVRINERLAAINGRSVENHIGRTIREVLPQISETVEPLLRRVIESGEPVLGVEVRGAAPAEPDVERRWITNYNPLKADDGSVIGVNVIVLDISERVWAEERARRHLEELAHVSRLATMGEMAAGLAHELNQPLTAMANFAFIGLQTLDGVDTPESARLRSLFADLSEQALRAGDIVQHLRGFIKKSKAQRDPLSVNELIHDVLAMVDAEVRFNELRLEIHLDETPAVVRADAIQIQQVLLNLLRNAMEAMSETPAAERRLSIAAAVRPDGFVEVVVADTGPGLPGDKTDRVFDAFYTTKPTGMGMGLAISRSIIEDHGGRLWAQAAEPGAVFRFTLPLDGRARE